MQYIENAERRKNKGKKEVFLVHLCKHVGCEFVALLILNVGTRWM
jgi:hypothetical protein